MKYSVERNNSHLAWTGSDQAVRAVGVLPPQARAFTLIELLVVIAIIAVLGGIVLGVSGYALETGRVSRVRGELSTLTAALEAYRVVHGDFPRTDDGAFLVQALIGRRGPTGTFLVSRPLIEVSRFSLTNDPFSDTTARLVDAWGTVYRYAYRSQSPWANPRYVLYSCGPDQTGNPILRSGGFLDGADPANRDNLFPDGL